jgi:hypothetical protein
MHPGGPFCRPEHHSTWTCPRTPGRCISNLLDPHPHRLVTHAKFTQSSPISHLCLGAQCDYYPVSVNGQDPNASVEGWFQDPLGRHEARWISGGKSTALVRDGDVEGDDPPEGPLQTAMAAASSPLAPISESEPEVVPDARVVTRQQNFQMLFGVSEEDLVSQGIDPRKYVRKNLAKVLAGDESKAHLYGVPWSSALLSESMGMGWRFYRLLFVGLIPLLVLAAKPPVFIKAGCLSLAFAALVLALWAMRRQICLYRKYKESCRSEGIEPETMLGRPMPYWRKRMASR